MCVSTLKLERSLAEKTETLENIQGLRISLERQLKELTVAKVSLTPEARQTLPRMHFSLIRPAVYPHKGQCGRLTRLSLCAQQLFFFFTRVLSFQACTRWNTFLGMFSSSHSNFLHFMHCIKLQSALESQVLDERDKAQRLQTELDVSEQVQKDFVKLSQTLQVKREK